MNKDKLDSKTAKSFASDDEGIYMEVVPPADTFRLSMMRKAYDLLIDAERHMDKWPECIQKPEKYQCKIALANSYIALAKIWHPNIEY